MNRFLLVRHDWPVEQCYTILNNIRQSMKPTSRLLIRKEIFVIFQGLGLIGTITTDEFVLQQAFRSDEDVIEQVRDLVLLGYSDTL